jgi:hypothetical protein
MNGRWTHVSGRVSLVAVLAFVAACGGGGGGGSPGPSVQAALSSAKVLVGDPVSLNWSSTDASSCTVTGLPGAPPAPRGSVTFQPSEGGRHTYSVACTGTDGRVATQDVSLVVPMPVFATSYENKNSIPFYDTALLNLRSMGIPPAFPDEFSSRGAVAFGDFFQEGEYAAFTTAFRATNTYVSPGTSDAPGVAYFLAKNGEGQWVDRTRELIPDEQERLNCVTNGYAIVADFNNDRRPDVYLACNGIDAEPLPEVKARLTRQQLDELGLSRQFVYLSTPAGTYRRVELPDLVYGFHASAADIDGDGNVDVLSSGDFKPFVYLGNGDGTFRRNDTIVPDNLHRFTDATPDSIHHDGLYMATLIPIDGRIDAVWSSNTNTVWMKGQPGGFDVASAITLEKAYSSKYGVQYRLPLEIMFDQKRREFVLGTLALVSDVTPDDAEYALLKYDTAGRYLGAFGVWLNPYNHNPADPLEIRFQSFSDQYKQLPSGDYKAYTAGCLGGLPGRCGQIIAYE